MCLFSKSCGGFVLTELGINSFIEKCSLFTSIRRKSYLATGLYTTGKVTSCVGKMGAFMLWKLTGSDPDNEESRTWREKGTI